MSKIVISREEFKDKVFACWLGKNIGGTFGKRVTVSIPGQNALQCPKCLARIEACICEK